MLDTINKPCFGPGRCVYKSIPNVAVLREIEQDTATWYLEHAGMFSATVYREKTEAERVESRKRFAATLDEI